MASNFRPIFRALAAVVMLVGLSACVAPYHGGHARGGYGNRGYASYQPAYRGGYAHGGYQRNWR